MQPDENTPEEPQSEPEDTSPAEEPAGEPEPEPETFPRSYVEELRQENGKYRQRAQKAETYAQRLHTELVRATGKLADPTDLPFDESHLEDVDKLTSAIDDLLQRKPHLASRRPTGEIGQGPTPSAGKVDLAAILRQRAR
jgi:hypothetical protein